MSKEKPGVTQRGEWRRWLGPMIPFLALGVVLLVALCVLVSAVIVSTPALPTDTPTPGLSMAQARDTATAQAAATQHAAQQTAPPTRFPTLTPSPTITPILSSYPFGVADEQVKYHPYSGGCDWLGVGGDVADMNDNPLQGVRVHVWGDGVDQLVLSGTSGDWGPAGWQVKLAEAPKVGRYHVQLVAADDSPLSPVVAFDTRDSCVENLVMVRFLQIALMDDE